MHEHAPVFAVGTDRHAVRIFSIMDNPSASFSLLQQQQPATATLAAAAAALKGTPTAPAIAALGLPALPATPVPASVAAGAPVVAGTVLSTFEPYSSFLHQSRGSPIAATAFHPHRMMVAGTALGDSHVNIYACRKGYDILD